MQLAMIGLGRMGANMVRRLIKDGHQCVVFDMSPKAVAELVREKALDDQSRDRRGRAGSGAFDRALRTFQLARRGELRRQAALRHALRIWRSPGEKRGLTATPT